MGFQVCFYSTQHSFLKLKVFLQKSIFHVSNLNTTELDPPTHSCQFDANCAKIQYVSDPKEVLQVIGLSLE